MIKIYLTWLLTTITFISQSECLAQNSDSYKASNGVEYKIGDNIKLGRGSAPNGDFVYLQMGGWAAGSSDTNIGKSYAGLAVTLKKIKKYKFKGEEKVLFVVGGGNITNYNLNIEDAIATCEVADCKKNEPVVKEDKYDRLKKLKDLLDQKIITQEEYDKEKTKILAEN
jgi:hypothetical protein